jgi:uncharacterized coiled-coil DUF342 family protein
VLDVSYHVSQYQTIISELRSEIGRLKEKIQSESTPARSSRKQAEELKELREEMVSNFQEQMKLRCAVDEEKLCFGSRTSFAFCSLVGWPPIGSN